jgi:RNA recognition motif-containing protein
MDNENNVGGDNFQKKDFRVFVGNLSFSTTWKGLKDHMSTAGEVAYADVIQQYGRSRGCGIVEYKNVDDAKKAIETLHDTTLDGRTIFVREDRDGPNPKKSNQGGSFGGGSGFQGNNNNNGGNRAWGNKNNNQDNAGFQGNNNAPIVDNDNANNNSDANNTQTDVNGGANDLTRKLYVGNLPYGTSWQELKDLFSKECNPGDVLRTNINKDRDQRSKGSGIVIMINEESAQQAIDRLNGTNFGGRDIFVKFDKY